jgi:hypothetical protein
MISEFQLLLDVGKALISHAEECLGRGERLGCVEIDCLILFHCQGWLW